MRHHLRPRAVTAAILFMGAFAATAGINPAISDAATVAHGASASYLAPYKAALEKATAPVKWDGPTTPAKAPKGLVVGAVNCSYVEAGCKSGGEAFQAATKALGWTDKNIIVDQPNGYAQAFQTLLNEHVKAIYLGGVEEQLIPDLIKTAAKEHIPVVSEGSNYAIGKPGEVNMDVHAPVADEGELMADDAIVQHNGDVNALLLQDAEFSEPVQVLKAVKATFAGCKQCKITYANPIDFTTTIVQSGLPGDVVTAIQSNPSINSIMLGFDPPATYIVPAMDAAGDQSKVSMYSQLGDSAPLSFVAKNNILKADAASSVTWGTWGDVDEIIRYLDHKPLVNENLPLQLFSSSAPSEINKLGKNNFAATFVPYIQKYEKLWGVK
jgi:ribose transport system substrate-binding protein